MSIIGKLIDWRRNAFLEGFLDRDLVETTYEEVWIELPTEKKIYAHIHSPAMPNKYPGIIFVPGGGSPGTGYDKGKGARAGDIAALGFTVLHYDPSGRGRTWGKEDYWGPINQQELFWVTNYFSKLPTVTAANIGILSFSIGIIVASGALARFPMPQVRYLFDWEGPSNRFNATKNNTHKPLKGFSTSDEDFWKEREAARFIGDIECGYFRYQAEIDDLQGTYKGHAIELLNRATKGKASWTRCNDNPTNTLFDDDRVQIYNCVPSRLNHGGQILKYLLDVQKEMAEIISMPIQRHYVP